MRRAVIWMLAWALAGVSATGLAAEPAKAQRELVVGTTLIEPFVLRDQDGVYRGLAMDLWDGIAEDLGLKYKVVEFGLEDLIKAVQAGVVDVAATALTVTSYREQIIDFSHPYYHNGLSIAVPANEVGGWEEVVHHLFSSRPVMVMGLILVGLVIMGLLLWLVERRARHTQLGDGAKGVGESLWWAAQTLSSVGYGDVTPVTLAGRILAFIWMLVSLVLVSLFTAVITTALTVTNLSNVVRDVQDLASVRVGTVAGSTSDVYLTSHRIDFFRYSTPLEGMRALADRKIDAFVFDEPVLQYIIKHELPVGLRMLPRRFDPQDYAFAVPNKSPLRKEINQALLRRIHSDSWKNILYHYLGDDAVPRGPVPQE
ncbi:MAG: transporter substrate-binding domain-containing protein [Pseudomonadota bacterium]